MVVNLVQSPDVVEVSTGDLVDVVLHGQLAVQVDTEVPDNLTLTRLCFHRRSHVCLFFCQHD